MLSSTTSFECSQPQMNEITPNSTRPAMSSLQINSNSYDVDGRKRQGAATAADQQAAAAAAPLKCPRCDSVNTKFCYYNNYSLSQPRHFCKACKRYWTRGGTLRNVPVGGGCRKTKQRVRQSPSTKPLAAHRSSRNNSYDNTPEYYQTARGQGQMEDPNLRLSGMLYGKSSPNMELFNGYGSSRVTDLSSAGARVNYSPGYSQIHNLGLGFSPRDYMRNQSTDSSFVSSYSALFGSNSPLARSGLGSCFEHEKLVNSEPSSLNKGQMGNYLSVLPSEEMPTDAGFGTAGIKVGDVGQIKFNQMGSLSSPSMDPWLHDWNKGASWPGVPNI